MSINSGQWTGFPSKRNRSTRGKFLCSNSYLIASWGVKNVLLGIIKVSFPSTRLSINESTWVLVFVKKLFILILLLLGFGEDFSNVFGKWLSEMVNFSFNFQVLPSRAFYKCFGPMFSSSFSQLLSNFDLFNSSILGSKATRSALFLASSSSSKISSSNNRSNKSNFLCAFLGLLLY